MRLSLFLLALLLAAPSAARAEPAKDATIRQLLVLTGAREQLAPVMRTLIDEQVALEVMQRAPTGATPDAIAKVFTEQSPAIKAVLERELAYERFEAEVVKVYAAEFTEAELAALVRFYQDPLGQAALQKMQAVQLKLANLLPVMQARAAAALAPPPPPPPRPANRCEALLFQVSGYRLGKTDEAFFRSLPGFSPGDDVFQGRELFKDYKTFGYHDSDDIYRKTALDFQYYQGAVFAIAVLKTGSRPDMEGLFQRSLATLEAAPGVVRTKHKSLWDGRENASEVTFLCDDRYSVELRFAELRPASPDMGIFTAHTTIEDRAARRRLGKDIEQHCQRKDYRAYPACAH